MNHFFLDPHLISPNRVKFPEDITHQILTVLRMRSGDQVKVLDNRGLIYKVEIVFDPHQKNVYGKIIGKDIVTSEPNLKLALFFGLTSRDKVEWILQKGTEIGVSEFFPFISSRTLVQSTNISEKKKTRWERIIREAAEQANRGRLPSLTTPKSLEECLLTNSDHDGISLIAWEGADTKPVSIKEILGQFDGSSISLFVGPEGGFSDEEIDSAKKAGCKVISLGERILRMETAAVVFPAIVLYELDKW